MVFVRKMQKNEMEMLYNIALHAFQPDYEKYGVYPPLLNLKNKRFLPPRIFGKTVYVGETVVGGALVAAFGKKGEIGSIFIDTPWQHKGYGKQVMSIIEQLYPNVVKWKLEVLADSHGLHKFYESLGYIKTGEATDKKSGLRIFQYEKTIM